MIKLYDERVTPKQYAKDILLSCLETACYWDERRPDEYDDMTPKERKLVNDQIDKLVKRIYKICG